MLLVISVAAQSNNTVNTNATAGSEGLGAAATVRLSTVTRGSARAERSLYSQVPH